MAKHLFFTTRISREVKSCVVPVTLKLAFLLFKKVFTGLMVEHDVEKERDGRREIVKY